MIYEIDRKSWSKLLGLFYFKLDKFMICYSYSYFFFLLFEKSNLLHF